MKNIFIILGVTAAIGVGAYLYSRRKKTTAPGTPSASQPLSQITPSQDTIAELKKKVVDQLVDNPFKDNVTLKLELMNEQDLRDMLRLLIKQRSGIAFGADDQPALTRLRNQYSVFGTPDPVTTGFNGMRIK